VLGQAWRALRAADPDLTRQVLDLERRHQERTTVTTAADHAAT
jgi:hypothetical protein